MSRRSGGDDLAYGDLPQRWDRSRFERFGGGNGGGGGYGGGPPRGGGYQEDYSYRETDRPGRRDVMVQDRIDERGSRGQYEERDRYYEQDRYAPERPRRRTDRELFGDVDPRDFANMALTRYEAPPPARPGLLRRQSSLDTFDRRPAPVYEREVRRIPVYERDSVPYDREYRREVDFQEDRGRGYYPQENYREIEIRREKSIGPYPPPPMSVKSGKSSKSRKSRRKVESSSSSSSDTERESVHTSRHGTKSRKGTSVHESFHEDLEVDRHDGHETVHFDERESLHGGNQSIHESIHETTKSFKKGKTRMPKRLVRIEAIQDLGYPFDEETDFYVLRIALEKDQIDEVIKISETYFNGEKKTVFQFDETKSGIPQINEPEREEVIRTEWINPPSVAPSRIRSHSHSGGTRASRSRRESRTSRQEVFEERDKEISLEVRQPSAPSAPYAPVYEVDRKSAYEEKDVEIISPNRRRDRSAARGALVVRRDPEGARSTREINEEIARMEAERRELRVERDGGKRELVVHRDKEEDTWYGRPAREVLELSERDREDLRLKEERRQERKAEERRRILKAAAFTLT